MTGSTVAKDDSFALRQRWPRDSDDPAVQDQAWTANAATGVFAPQAGLGGAPALRVLPSPHEGLDTASAPAAPARLAAHRLIEVSAVVRRAKEAKQTHGVCTRDTRNRQRA